MKRLHEEMKELKEEKPDRPRRENVEIDIDQERIVMKEKMRQARDLPHEERQKFKAQVQRDFEARQRPYGDRTKSFDPSDNL
jgi:hypothetical protein